MPKLHSKAGQTAHLEADYLFLIAASDTVDIAQVGSLVHCNQTGNCNLLLSGNDTPTVLFLVGGVSYPFRIRRLFVTDTDFITGLVGLSSVHVIDDVL